MKYLLIVYLTFLSLYSFSQTAIENFDDCSGEIFYIKVEEEPQFDNLGEDLYTYLNNAFENYKLFDKANGKIWISIIINEKGKACCKSFGNKTNKEVDSGIVREIINNMPNWKPAKQAGEIVVFLNNLILTVENGKIIKQ
ncbi:MAG: hypothetical protein A2W99_16105 [Bacteroidetes bacterium GWF2_33_16]|nr:MAG: hypothetical protein A2X00_15450 [Bacteroidetes bacterium GWE2_32_14]OFY02425.1 MAG: hypothetical protein A2W99_16105 [Bacteroidetes bacterium GWF2_33_16]